MTWQINAWFINHCPAFICPCFTLCLHHMSRNQTNEVLNGSRGTGVRSCWLLSRSPLSLSNNSTVLKTQQGQFVYIFVTQSNIWPRKKSLPLSLGVCDYVMFHWMLLVIGGAVPILFFSLQPSNFIHVPTNTKYFYWYFVSICSILKAISSKVVIHVNISPPKIWVFLLNNFKNWCQ